MTCPPTVLHDDVYLVWYGVFIYLSILLGNAISKTLKFKIFWGSMPLNPPLEVCHTFSTPLAPPHIKYCLFSPPPPC